ncbi:sodium:proton exchanger [Dietzia sp.]|uniref:sodium:proton exchanger n=1 Tax=Dietzia sp. TaxID=1871616 RepID=UPI003FA5B89C
MRLVRGLAICLAVAIPALVLRISGAEVPAPVALLAYGAAVVAASFALAWAADAARKDISGPLAVSLLALVAVLPEYAVDLYYAFRSGSDAAYLPFAAANMNGSNRLLLGLGWPLVVLLSLWAARRFLLTAKAGDTSATAPTGQGPADGAERPEKLRAPKALHLPASVRKDVAVLAVLTIIALLIPITGAIPLWFGIVLIAAFIAYLWSSSRSEADEEEDFVSLAAEIALLPRRARRWLVGVLFVVAAGVILASAEPFAESLVATGTSTGIDPYFLVQWLAPLASESPEFIVAALFALSGRGALAIGTLIASKINQWSLLVGSLPVAHLLGGGDTELPLDGRQIEEFSLTASQALLGVAILISLRFHRYAAIALAALFALQFVVTGTEGRWVLTVIHAAIAVGLLVWHRADIRPTFAALGEMGRDMLPSRSPAKPRGELRAPASVEE